MGGRIGTDFGQNDRIYRIRHTENHCILFILSKIRSDDWAAVFD